MEHIKIIKGEKIRRPIGIYKAIVATLPKEKEAKNVFMYFHDKAMKGCIKSIELLNKFFGSVVSETKNIVPDVYLESMAANMVTAGGSLAAADELRVTYIAVGTGTDVPAAGDTKLKTEVFRDTIDSQADSSKVAVNVLFIGLTEANGNTLAEVGAFAGAATGVADSGTIASHTLLSPTVAKTAAKTVTLELRTTFADA